MIRLASLTLVIGAVLLLTWVLAPASARPHQVGPVGASQTDPPRAAGAADAAEVAAEVARLRARLAAPATYPKPGRDPFRFGHIAEPARSAPPVPIVSAPPPPPLPRLVAILSDTIDGALVRRAAVGVESGVRIVRVGDLIGALRVAAIAADGIDLVDAATGATFRVPLR